MVLQMIYRLSTSLQSPIATSRQNAPKQSTTCIARRESDNCYNETIAPERDVPSAKHGLDCQQSIVCNYQPDSGIQP